MSETAPGAGVDNLMKCRIHDCCNQAVAGKLCCHWHSDKEQDYQDMFKDTFASIILAMKTIRERTDERD